MSIFNAAAAVLTFREGLEAALIIAIVLTYLRRTGRTERSAQVWAGAGTAALLTAVFITVLQVIGASFTYPAQGIYEGVTSLLAVAMVTSMTFWMARHGRQIKRELEREVAQSVEGGRDARGAWLPGLGLFGVAFLAVGREGIETGLFLAAAAFASTGVATLTGGLAGLALAGVIAWLIYVAGLRLNLGLFFRVAGVLLIFFGAAMLRYAVQEFEEVGLVPPLVERVWNTGGWLPDSTGAGAVLAALLGYTAHPSLAQLLAYTGYFGAVVLALVWPSLRGLALSPAQPEQPALAVTASVPVQPAAPRSASLLTDVAVRTGGEVAVQPAAPRSASGRRRWPWLLFSAISLLALATLLGGCERAGAAATGPLPAGMQEITISAKDNYFDPKSVSLPAQKVRVTFVNDGRNVHEPEIKGLTPETKLAPGQRVSFDITPKAGTTYRLYCEIHEAQGMEGTVTVKS